MCLLFLGFLVFVVLSAELGFLRQAVDDVLGVGWIDGAVEGRFYVKLKGRGSPG